MQVTCTHMNGPRLSTTTLWILAALSTSPLGCALLPCPAYVLSGTSISCERACLASMSVLLFPSPLCYIFLA